MLDAATIRTLEVGDAVELPPMMKGLCTEPMVLKTVEVHPDRVDFVSTYFGVALGRWTANLKGSKVSWSL